MLFFMAHQLGMRLAREAALLALERVQCLALVHHKVILQPKGLIAPWRGACERFDFKL